VCGYGKFEGTEEEVDAVHFKAEFRYTLLQLVLHFSVSSRNLKGFNIHLSVHR